MYFNNIINSISNILMYNNKNNNDNLNQGKLFIKYNKIYNNKNKHKLLQKNTSTNISSIIETLESNNSSKHKIIIKDDKNSKLNDEFNRTLSEYTILYKVFMDNINNKNTLESSNDSDHNYAYVNTYGYTHKYIANNTNNSKPVLNGQARKLSGQNIKNKETNQISWVDIKGYKHVYPSNIWNHKNNKCNTNPIILNSKEYESIPSSASMETSYMCDKNSLTNDKIWQNLLELNSTLIFLSKEILDNINGNSITDSATQNQINEKKTILNNYISQFQNELSAIKNLDSDTMNGQKEMSESYLNYNHYQYVLWFICFIILLFILLKIS